MSNTKYDWSAHMDRIVELYKEGHSIPKICKAIQNEPEGFTPSLGILYSTLRSAGWPTDHTERTKLLRSLNIARWPSEVLSITSINSNQRQSPATSFKPQNTVSRDKSKILSSPHFASPQANQHEARQEPFSTSMHCNAGQSQPLNWRGLTPITETEKVPENEPFPLPEDPTSSWLEQDDTTSFQEPSDLTWEVGGAESLPDFGVHYPDDVLKTPSLPPSEVHIAKPGRHVPPESCSASEDLRLETNDAYRPDSIYYENSPDVFDTPSPSTRPTPSNTNFSQLSARSSLGDRFLPFRKLKTWNNRCSTPEKRHSTATTDSGYASGRNSPFNLLTEVEQIHPQCLTEFKGLYRVPCSHLHEPRSYNEDYMPQSMARFKDIEKCSNCQYSGIHNLSWSATQLKPEVFLAELKLDAIYNFTALDAAGNSALHYAAAGGATYEHFSALIKAGVNPYQLNTGGQLFLHCLRPKLKKPGDDSFDSHLVTAFNLNLVNLLNRFRATGAFRWRDNGGMTAVDALALQINDVEATRQIFHAVLNAGHPLEVSPRFKKAPKIIKSTNYQLSSLVSDSSLTPQGPDVHHKGTIEKIEERQKKAWDLLGRASAEPSYVDPETGDNALHALSYIRFPHNGSHMKILSKIRAFVLKDGVDLNLQNREQESPLTAIICNRPFQGMESDETGATMSKYLDALLWRDSLRRIPNNINVNMRNRKGATALYYAAIRGRPDSVRSLIEAGANANARLKVDGHAISILQATLNAKARAVEKSHNDVLSVYLYNNVLSYLEHENAVAYPTLFDERRVADNSVRLMPM